MIADLYARSVVATCTRDGSTSWQNVANMLGVSRETAMRLYGPMDPVITLDPPNTGPVETLPEPACYRSTRAKANMRMAIMAVIRDRSESVGVLAERIGSTPDSVRNRLLALHKDGVAVPDGGYPGRPKVPSLWGLTPFGREVYDRERQTEGKAA
jgi:hypothetical protein